MITFVDYVEFCNDFWFLAEAEKGSMSSSSRTTTGASKKSYTVQDNMSKSRMSTASRKTQTSQDVIQKEVEKIKAKIKTGEDIDAQEVLQAVLLMLDDMRMTMKQLENEKAQEISEVEVINHEEPLNSINGEKHSLLNVNVKSIKKNIAALQMYIQLAPTPSFVVVTETSTQELDQAQLGKIYQFQKFKILRRIFFSAGYHDPIFKTRNATKLKGGGVGIYVKNTYGMKLCEKLVSTEYKVKHVEFVGVEASLEDFWKVLIVGIFRPAGKSPSDILKELELIFKVALDTKLPTLIAGDFNIDVNNANDALAKKYIALINKYSLKMVVKEPTRISAKSNAIFDHVLVNDLMTSEVTATVQASKIADHQITLAEWS